jgi:phosphatidylserine/phosphatidylglycerophosphate/cardiolipin synthase-like enzyme
LNYLRKYLCFLGLGLALTLPLTAQQDISAARAMGEGSTVTVRGIVTSGEELGTIRFLQDHTAGIALYSSEVSHLIRGDSVSVTGVLKDYSSLLELDPVQSVTVLSQGHTLPQPHVLTPGELEESYEGMLVRVEEAQLGATGVFQRDAYGFTANGETGQLYINDPYSPLIGTPIPTGSISISGPLGSYQDSYQILPRDQDDLQSESSIKLVEAPRISQLSTEGFTLEWTTDVAGTSEAMVGLSPDLELTPIKLAGTATSHSLEIDGLNPAELFYIQAFSVLGEDTARAALQTVITVSESSGSFRVLFNRGFDPSVSLGILEAEYLPDGLDDELISYIDQAEESIDIAIYNLNNSGISDISAALNRAHARGVVVRAVYDGDVNASGMQTLNASIGKIASPRSDYPVYGIMHNKFVIIDAHSSNPLLPIVWTGSTNLSRNQINIDPNNVVVIQDQSLAKAYELEFNEMFGSGGPLPDPDKARFGPDKRDNTPHEFVIGGKRVECYFSPTDGTHQQILNAITSSDYSIQVATMLITKQDIGTALVGKNEAGREVQVLINDYDQYGEPVLNALKASLRQDVRLNGEAGIMHHKYMMVDQSHADSDPLVLTGSHNWSASAQLRNDENTLIIYHQGVANAYYQEFVRRFAAGEILVSDKDRQLNENEAPVRIYPNPASEWIRIESYAGAEIESLIIIDPAGREMLRYQRPLPEQIPLQEFTEGLYLIKLRLTGGEQVHSLLIIR